MASEKAVPPYEARLYSRVDVLEHNVTETKLFLTDFAKEVREYMRQQQSAPRPIPFKEIIVTAAATLTVVGFVLNFLDSRTERSLEVHKYRIELLEKSFAAR